MFTYLNYNRYVLDQEMRSFSMVQCYTEVRVTSVAATASSTMHPSPAELMKMRHSISTTWIFPSYNSC